MKIKVLVIMSGFLFINNLYAQDVMVANDNDLDSFERVLENQEINESDDVSFGDWVSAEAQLLKDANVQERREFGQKVSDQVRQDAANRPEESYKRDEIRPSVRQQLPQSARDRAGNQIGAGSTGQGERRAR